MIKRAPAALLISTAIALGGWQLSKARTFQLFGTIVPRVETQEQVVALTFDDGPEHQGWLVPVLRGLGVHATFYVIGGGVAADLATTRQIVAAGHELGNHSFSHARMVFKLPGWIAGEVESTDRLIRLAGYQGPITFRPPYGKKLVGLPWYLWRTGRTTVTWDLEPDSNGKLPVDEQIRAVLDGVRPGSIILLHGEQPGCRQVVPAIVRGLRQRGYRFLRVSELRALAQAAH